MWLFHLWYGLSGLVTLAISSLALGYTFDYITSTKENALIIVTWLVSLSLVIVSAHNLWK